MVVESTGAWSTSASHTLRLLARATAAREGEDAASCYTHLLQELCVTARRFRGRAALRRRAELGSPTEADGTRRDAALLLATAASSSWSCVWSHLLRLHSIAFATIAIQTPGQQFSLLAQQNSVSDMCSGLATPVMATVPFCITIGKTLCKWLASSFISSYPSHATKSWPWKCVSWTFCTVPLKHWFAERWLFWPNQDFLTRAASEVLALLMCCCTCCIDVENFRLVETPSLMAMRSL
jgi:hypothetical protein